MPKLTDSYRRVSLDKIWIDRDSRQRKDIDVLDLVPSVKRNGVINPVIVEEGSFPDNCEYKLLAGERRILASREAGLLDIPVRLITELSPVEAQIIELEENLKRKDLGWVDMAEATARVHKLHLQLDPGWTMGETAEALSVTIGWVSINLRVALALAEPRVATAGTLREAYNYLQRKEQRAAGDAIEDLIGLTKGLDPPAPSGASSQPAGPQREPTATDPANVVSQPVSPPDILNMSFLDWAPAYRGPKFNLIHCDFPYGVNLFATPDERQIKKDEVYEDTGDSYWDLLKCLTTHLDNFMSLSGHIMFWFSETQGLATRNHFATECPELVIQTFPLVWHKSDNAGLVSDVRRRPRHVYETCLLISRGDRHLVGPKADLYACPTDKSLHPSAKPEPMLRHFLSMLTDEYSTLLDPTCGSGSALRAAETLGATRVCGLEISAEYTARAQQALTQARLLRAASAAASSSPF